MKENKIISINKKKIQSIRCQFAQSELSRRSSKYALGRHVPTIEGWLYLAIIIALFSKR